MLERPFPAQELTPWIAFGPSTRTRTRVCLTAQFEILVLGWLPGQLSSVHDHGSSACGVRVIQGVATERVGTAEALGAPRHHEAEAALTSHPGEWHEIRNDGQERLITLHVYAPPLSYGGVVPQAAARKHAVVVIGGGIRAATLAVELGRQGATEAMALTVVEPVAAVERGLASASDRADHWNLAGKRMRSADDPPGTCLDRPTNRDVRVHPGDVPLRAHLGDSVRERWTAACGNRVTHIRTRAFDLRRSAGHWRVSLEDGTELLADALVLATGNASPRDLTEVRSDDSVLIVGTGLHVIETIVSLRRRGHRAPIVLLSRRGMLPRLYAAPPTSMPKPTPTLESDPCATRPDFDLTHADDALIRRLLARGVLCADEHAIGLHTDDDGTAIDARGERVEGLYVLGGARDPANGRCTATPELRMQARALGAALVASARRESSS